jgi:hypothetical protein
MARDEAQRLRIDERSQHRLHRLGDELAELLGPVAGKDEQPVLCSTANRLVARAARDEEELPGRRLQQLPARDQATLAERAGERESGGPPQERPVEIEEGGRRHAAQALRPAAALASSGPG